jgi:hypothetical protein
MPVNEARKGQGMSWTVNADNTIYAMATRIFKRLLANKAHDITKDIMKPRKCIAGDGAATIAYCILILFDYERRPMGEDMDRAKESVSMLLSTLKSMGKVPR